MGEQENCPFCPILSPDHPELWEAIGYENAGTPARIGDVRSCRPCAVIACVYGNEEELLAQLKQVQEDKESER